MKRNEPMHARADRVVRAKHALYLRERAALTALSVWEKAGGLVPPLEDRHAERRTLWLLDRIRHSTQQVKRARAAVAQAKRDARRGAS